MLEQVERALVAHQAPETIENNSFTPPDAEAEPLVCEADNRRLTGGEPPVNIAVVARNGSGRFVRGTGAGAATRYRKGRSGNPKGRPPRRFKTTRFRAGTRAAAALLDAQGPALAEKAIELALGGDAVAVRFCLGRLLGTRRGQPVELDLKPVAAPADLTAAVAAITGAVAEGRVTPDEAHALSRMLDGLPRVFAAVPPPPRYDGEDPRKTLARKLARLAKSVEADALRQSQALGSPSAQLAPRLDAAVTEQQETIGTSSNGPPMPSPPP